MMIMVAALMLAACQPAAAPVVAQGPGGNGQRPNFQMQPAPELPTTQSAAQGVIVNRNGNTLTVREGFGGFAPGAGGTPRATFDGTPRATFDGTPRPRPTQVGGGTEVTVTVTSDTVIYQDVTFANLNGQTPSGTIQQKVETSSLSGISDNSRVTIWGDRTGDQIIAKVVVYSEPRAFQQP
jgi:hypothetical protein